MELLEDAIQVITKHNLWEWLRNYKPHMNEGYALDYHPNMVLLYSGLQNKPISGATFTWLMTELHKIAIQRSR
jgi:hypothetical protein